MQSLFYLTASVVLAEFGYYLWLLIRRERSHQREIEYDGATLMETVREEWGDGVNS
tara:strand:- start:1238 stop:1405 length:168 start_codon:yes stop_codon:yes gene_type:complete